MAITIDNTVGSLNQYHTTFKQGINSKLRVGLEFENMLMGVQTEHTYSAPNVTPSDIVQAYQVQFTPNNSETWSGVDNSLEILKIDISWTMDDLQAFFDKWAVNWAGAGKDPLEWNYPRFIYETVLLPKIIEEMNRNSWVGEYVAPTPGTPGLTVNSVTGFKKKLEDAIAAGDVTPVPVGALSAAGMVDSVETFCDSIPQPYRDAPGTIIMNTTRSRQYARDYRAEFQTGNGVGNNPNTELRVDFTGKRVKGLINMEGSDRFMFIPDTNPRMIWGIKRGLPAMPVIRWEKFERQLKGLAEFHRFYGFEYWEEVFVSDQA